MNILQGNIETIMEYLQAQKAITFANPDTDVIVTSATAMTTSVVDVVTTLRPMSIR